MRFKKALLPATVLLSALILTGCKTTGGEEIDIRSGVIPCEVDPPISWSKKDTPETARGVVGHNAVVKKLCPGVKPDHIVFGGRRVPTFR